MPLALIDGTNVVMRYASAMGPVDREATEEEADKIVSAVIRAMHQFAEQIKAEHMVVALDSGVGSWRRDIFPEYKQHRTTNTLAWTNRLAIACHAASIYTARCPAYEADDVIATVARRTAQSGRHTCVLSGDSDLLQLVSLSCAVFQFGKSPEPKFVSRSMQWIREKYELQSAGHLTIYKALVGEPGDGLPGVPQIGPVKARKLLALAQQPNDIEMLLKGEVEVEAFRRALVLVTLKDDAPIEPILPSQCRIVKVTA